jgi:hypothetical protein
MKCRDYFQKNVLQLGLDTNVFCVDDCLLWWQVVPCKISGTVLEPDKWLPLYLSRGSHLLFLSTTLANPSKSAMSRFSD